MELRATGMPDGSGRSTPRGDTGKGITRRSHKVKDQNFTEETLPVESVAEYFEHFPIFEIDYTFYRPFWNPKGALPRITMS